MISHPWDPAICFWSQDPNTKATKAVKDLRAYFDLKKTNPNFAKPPLN